jgi:hypothetical protein
MGDVFTRFSELIYFFNFGGIITHVCIARRNLPDAARINFVKDLGAIRPGF